LCRFLSGFFLASMALTISSTRSVIAVKWH
jgi:hypothetical protein